MSFGSPVVTGLLLLGLFVVVARGFMAIVRTALGEHDVVFYEHVPFDPAPLPLHAVTVLRSNPFDWQHECPELRDGKED